MKADWPLSTLHSPWSLVGVSGYGPTADGKRSGQSRSLCITWIDPGQQLDVVSNWLKYLTGCFVDLDRGEGKGG